MVCYVHYMGENVGYPIAIFGLQSPDRSHVPSFPTSDLFKEYKVKYTLFVLCREK